MPRRRPRAAALKGWRGAGGHRAVSVLLGATAAISGSPEKEGIDWRDAATATACPFKAEAGFRKQLGKLVPPLVPKSKACLLSPLHLDAS